MLIFSIRFNKREPFFSRKNLLLVDLKLFHSDMESHLLDELVTELKLPSTLKGYKNAFDDLCRRQILEALNVKP